MARNHRHVRSGSGNLLRDLLWCSAMTQRGSVHAGRGGASSPRVCCNIDGAFVIGNREGGRGSRAAGGERWGIQ